MKVIDSGYGNSGDLSVARERAWTEGPHRYLVIKTSGGDPEAIGGDFNYEISGTDKIGELLNLSVIRESEEILDTRMGEVIDKAQLARRYVKSLNSKQREALLEEAIQRFILGDSIGG